MNIDDRVAACERALLSACREWNLTVSGDGRVSERDAAQLLGYSDTYVKEMRSEGKGPAHYNVGMNGSRISYALADVARWIESRREG